MWLGIAEDDGTITWYMTFVNCQSKFDRMQGYPSMNFPGTTWDVAITKRVGTGAFNMPTFIGNNKIAVFTFDQGTGIPQLQYTVKIPWNFVSTKTRTVVGYGNSFPFPGSSSPSLAVARELSDGKNQTGELLLIDPDTGHATVKYLSNIRGWQSGPLSANSEDDTDVAAIALIDPDPGDSNGFILGFLPNKGQPTAIPYPWKPSQRWSAGVSWTSISQTEWLGVFVVGTAKPGTTSLTLRFVVITTSGSFALSPKAVPIKTSKPVWIPDTPSFLSAPADLESQNSLLWFSAQNKDGPVIFVIPYPNIKEILQPLYATNFTTPLSEHQYDKGSTPWVPHFSSEESQKRSVLCDTKSLCKLLSPGDDCGSKCCQTYLQSKPHQFISACCRDCNLGNCVGDPGACVN